MDITTMRISGAGDRWLIIRKPGEGGDVKRKKKTEAEGRGHFTELAGGQEGTQQQQAIAGDRRPSENSAWSLHTLLACDLRPP